jgi:hypothetical protein
MSRSCKLIAIALCACLCAPLSPAQAQQDVPARAAETSDAQVFGKLCFQCHGPGMWSDLRQDRRGWESLLYRHVGRGALWTEDEITRMANYLTATFGPQPVKPSKQ